MDKVLSWKDIKNVLTKVSGDSDNRCPSYNRIKCYEEGYDNNNVAPKIHQFKIISKAHFRSGSIEIWIDGQEKN